jgi:anaphase-promoting complex subunit 3
LKGKAYFELCDYKLSLSVLKDMLKIEPYRTKGVETLSTVLWHLKKDKELSALAQQVKTSFLNSSVECSESLLSACAGRWSRQILS